MSFLFETERLSVRQYNMDDLPGFTMLNSDEDVMRYIRKPKNPEECRIFLQENIRIYDEQSYAGRLAVEKKDTREFVGSFAIIPVTGTELLQVGYSLLKPFWGLGYASELVKGCIPYLIEKNINPVYGITYPENIPSQHVLLKNGFVFEKKFVEDKIELYRYVLEWKAG